MSDDESPVDLDANALAILAAYRRSEQLPVEVESRVWERVESKTTPIVAPTSTRWGVVALVAAAAVALLAVGIRSFNVEEAESAPAGNMAVDRGEPAQTQGVATAGRVEKEARQRHPAAPSSQSANSAEPEAAPPPVEAETHDSSSDFPEAERGPRAVRRSKSRPTSNENPKPESISSLADETRLLRRAQAAMRQGQPNQALSLLAECQRAFPDGMLLEERDALKVLALCDAGKTSKGKAAAAKFLRARPGSALADRVRGACGDEN